MALSKDELINLIQQYAAMFGIDQRVAVAQHRRESANFRMDVIYGPFVGSAGEKGISQFTPGTWARFGSGLHQNAYDPVQSLQAWGKYMTFLLRRFNGDWVKTLQGYNGGEGNVDKNTVSKAAQAYAREILGEAGMSPPPPVNPIRPPERKKTPEADKKTQEFWPSSGPSGSLGFWF